MVNLNKKTVKEVFASVDWGYSNPGVILVFALDGDRRMYLVHEVYQTGKLVSWWVAKADELRKHFGITTFVCDPAEPAYIMEFTNAGLPAESAYNPIARGVQAVKERLKVQPDGRPRLFLMEGAREDRDESLDDSRKPTCTAEELDGYVWAKSADGRPIKEEPIKINDHGCDALRYACAYVDDLGQTSVEFW